MDLTNQFRRLLIALLIRRRLNNQILLFLSYKHQCLVKISSNPPGEAQLSGMFLRYEYVNKNSCPITLKTLRLIVSRKVCDYELAYVPVFQRPSVPTSCLFERTNISEHTEETTLLLNLHPADLGMVWCAAGFLSLQYPRMHTPFGFLEYENSGLASAAAYLLVVVLGAHCRLRKFR